MSLNLVIALLSIFITPVTLALLSSASGIQLVVSPVAVAETVGGSILLPMLAGIVAGWLFPVVAERAILPLEALSNVAFTLAAFILLLSTYHLLLAMDFRSYLAIALMIVGALAAGYVMAPGRSEEKRTLALESATRNTGLALLIASTYVPLEKALPVLIPYMVTAVIIDRVYLKYRKTGPGSRTAKD